MTETVVPKTIEWIGGLNGYVAMIDQTRLPAELSMIECRDVKTMWEAIQTLAVRGAPAIGIAAAMGAILAVRNDSSRDRAGFLQKLGEACDYLATARPTAVNLFWALGRIRECAESVDSTDVDTIKLAILEEARRIRDEDAATCRAIGRHGERLVGPETGILTYCNAGGLATAEYGTALAPLYRSRELGRSFRVYACETRPLLQGARLTAWELLRAGVDVTLICDNMAGALMAEGKVDLVITGADRIAANGDTANKIGTYGLAVLANAHSIPFYIAAPRSTFDRAVDTGAAIPIEYRDESEIRFAFGRCITPPDVPCYVPAFDVTPAGLIRGIITEVGIIERVDRTGIMDALSGTGACPDPAGGG